MPICGNMPRTAARQLKATSFLGFEPDVIDGLNFIFIASFRCKP
jgi:hypothetical protein